MDASTGFLIFIVVCIALVFITITFVAIHLCYEQEQNETNQTDFSEESVQYTDFLLNDQPKSNKIYLLSHLDDENKNKKDEIPKKHNSECRCKLCYDLHQPVDMSVIREMESLRIQDIENGVLKDTSSTSHDYYEEFLSEDLKGVDFSEDEVETEQPLIINYKQCFCRYCNDPDIKALCDFCLQKFNPPMTKEEEKALLPSKDVRKKWIEEQLKIEKLADAKKIFVNRNNDEMSKSMREEQQKRIREKCKIIEEEKRLRKERKERMIEKQQNAENRYYENLRKKEAKRQESENRYYENLRKAEERKKLVGNKRNFFDSRNQNYSRARNINEQNEKKLPYTRKFVYNKENKTSHHSSVQRGKFDDELKTGFGDAKDEKKIKDIQERNQGNKKPQKYVGKKFYRGKHEDNRKKIERENTIKNDGGNVVIMY